jgi:hypothetical protein
LRGAFSVSVSVGQGTPKYILYQFIRNGPVSCLIHASPQKQLSPGDYCFLML